MSPVAMAVKLEAILADIERGMFFSEIAAKHGVTQSVVRQLVFGPEACRICDKCEGNGILEGKSGKTTGCDKCKGEGHVCPS